MVNLFNRFWCETCDTFSKSSCNQEKHKIIDLISKDVEEHDALVVQVENGAQEALDKRNEGEEPLAIEEEQLQAKLDAVKAQIKENKVHKEKLMEVVAKCKKMKQLPPARKATAFIRKNLEKTLEEVKEELKMANEFLKRGTTKAVNRPDVIIFFVLFSLALMIDFFPIPFLDLLIIFCSLLKQVTNVTAAAVEEDDSAIRQPPLLKLPNFFSANCFSAHRQQIVSSQLFRSQELTGHTGSIIAMEFSDDGTLLVAGGKDKTVRLWYLNQGHGERNSTEMEAKHELNVTCLAFSPDNHRIFSGGLDKKVLIHDTRS